VVSREALAHQRESTRADVWWATFKWASDRAIPHREDDQALPPNVTISTLKRLAEDATTDTQKAACASVIDVVTNNVEHARRRDREANRNKHSAPTSYHDTALAALASYVSSSRGTAAASTAAEGWIYAEEVREALTGLSAEDPSITVLPRVGRADAVVEVRGREVVVEIKRPSSARAVPDIGYGAVEQLKSTRAKGQPGLLVLPFDLRLSQENQERHRIVATQWRSSADTPRLLEDLRRAAALADIDD